MTAVSKTFKKVGDQTGFKKSSVLTTDDDMNLVLVDINTFLGQSTSNGFVCFQGGNASTIDNSLPNTCTESGGAFNV